MKKATINFITGMDGSYALHGQTGWDDLPYWEYYKAWIVEVIVEGILFWGPFKYRKNAKKEHSGEALMQISETRIFNDSDCSEEIAKCEAEEYTLDFANNLEKRGFKVELNFINDKSQKDFRRKITSKMS